MPRLIRTQTATPRLLHSKSLGERLARVHCKPTHPSLSLPTCIHRPVSAHSKWRGVMDIRKGSIASLPLHAIPKLTGFQIHARFWRGVVGFCAACRTRKSPS
ncbi:hypothetical protein AVEN_50021-1 [Araneus ventricosus]|uniref:Uncharacterized protein n=1 Tax=Araneus ventricosus TaxID=182803 RepID=A0A4Y2D0T2_ARAVE|nr:hypothetical protein AVEN_50021-1 [Araneus ventricosus]